MAFEPGAAGSSRRSSDRGETWSELLGAHGRLPGAYLARYRSQAAVDPAAPAPDSFQVSAPEALRSRIPDFDTTDADELALAVTAWIAGRVSYHNSAERMQYGPWDGATILDWTGSADGFDDQPAITMCVQKGMLTAAILILLGVPARGIVWTAGVGVFDGHFCAEYWSDRYQKWVFLDPTLGIFFRDRDISLGGLEVSRRRTELGELTVSVATSPLEPVVEEWWKSRSSEGRVFTHYGIWPRSAGADATGAPPGHGAVEFCETDIVRLDSCSDAGFGMFGRFAPESYFTVAPQHAVPQGPN